MDLPAGSNVKKPKVVEKNLNEFAYCVDVKLRDAFLVDINKHLRASLRHVEQGNYAYSRVRAKLAVDAFASLKRLCFAQKKPAD